jgi:hypothetical protein
MSLPQVDPLEHTLLHRLLVNTNRLQELPIWVVILFILFNVSVVALDWAGRHGTTDAVRVAVAFVVTTGIDWALLRALPRNGRSYGPDSLRRWR